MARRPHRRFRLRYAVFPLLGLFVLGYFVYHVVEGDRGVRAWNKLNHEIEAAKAERTGARARQRDWQRKVAMLREGTINEDMLDERARAMLNYARRDEIVILYTRPLTAD